MDWIKLIKKVVFGGITGAVAVLPVAVDPASSAIAGLIVGVANGLVNFLKHYKFDDF